jgi:hypothetical protein
MLKFAFKDVSTKNSEHHTFCNAKNLLHL